MELKTLLENRPTIYQFGCFNEMKRRLDNSIIEKESIKKNDGRIIPRVTKNEAEKFIKYMSFKYGLGFSRFV